MKIKPASLLFTGLPLLIGLGLALGLLFCIKGWAQPIGAKAAPAELTVCASGCDYTNLQEAEYAAASGDVIKIAGGVYTGVHTIDGANQIAAITKSLTVRGGYSPDFSTQDPQAYTTTLDAQGQGRVMVISGDITVTLDGLNMINGRWGTQEDITYDSTYSWWRAPAGGGLRVQDAHLTLLNSRLYKNDAYSGIGSGLCQRGGSLTMEDSTVQENGGLRGYPFKGGSGGGLFLLQVDSVIRDSSILSNTASNTPYEEDAYGGGIYLNRGTAVIENTLFQGNQAGKGGSEDADGGGMDVEFTRLTLTGSTFIGNVAVQSTYGHGGALYLNGAVNAVVNNNVFRGNYAELGSGPSWGGALFSYSPATVTNNLFEGNYGNPSYNNSRGGGVYFSAGGEFSNNTVRNNQALHGGGANFDGSVRVTGNLFEGNQAGSGSSGNGGGILVDNLGALEDNTILSNTAGSCGGGLFVNTSANDASLDGNLIQGNNAYRGAGMYINRSAAWTNNVWLNNTATVEGAGIYIGDHTGTLEFKHSTLAGNTGGAGSAVFVNAGSASFANTILAGSPTGIQNVGSGTVLLDHTLYDQVGTPTDGPVGDAFASSGEAGFAADGYHLGKDSAAVDAGLDIGVAEDVDGEARPQGQAPDLGADESPYGHSAGGSGLQVGKSAGTPHWVMYTNGINVPPSSYLQQDYVIRLDNGSAVTTPVVSSFTLKDDFPSELELATVASQPNLDYTRNGSQITWNSEQALDPGDWAWFGMTGRSGSVQAGETIVNNASLAYVLPDGAHSQDLEASTEVPARPIFPPLILSPKNGEMCLDESGQLVASGLAGAGMRVRLYENGSFVGDTLADASGVYTITWTTQLSDSVSVNLHAQACEPGSGGDCSASSSSVHLDYPQGYWCPQRSYWEGHFGSAHFIFHFRNDAGAYATNDFVIPGMHGFAGTQIHLYSCCDADTNPFKVIADDVEYVDASEHDGRWWTFTIGSAHFVSIESQCMGGGHPSGGRVLIDPDGFVFDSTRGGSYDDTTGMFSPVQAIPGITVTAYVSVPEWGGWMPWPAHLYDNQINPQVTGSDGYFAFFTPPGFYYLQATGSDGYEAWRSPLIEVITEVVHMNIPLTPWGTGTSYTVNLTPQGIDQPTLTVPAGSRVTWNSSLPAEASVDEWSLSQANPLLRLLSALDPLTNVLGWDSGMLPAGNSYVRQFNTPGVYEYTDEAGHSGQVVVEPGSIFLPVLQR